MVRSPLRWALVALLAVALAWSAAVVGQPRGAAPASHSTMSGDSVSCAQCHLDNNPHQDTADQSCASCHETTSWSPSTFTVDAHSQTGFPLDGQHLQLSGACRDDSAQPILDSCCSCHTPGFPRRGFSARAADAADPAADPTVLLSGLSKECATCHAGPHRLAALQGSCDRCHATIAFAQVPEFDHSLTGFTLDGPHAHLAGMPTSPERRCGSCHGGGTGAALTSFRTQHPAAKAVPCETCHVPTHGTFPGTCADCHPSGQPFAEGSFAHAATGWSLDRRHSAARCGDCHPPAGTHPRAVAASASQCADCHRDPHAGQVGATCSDCHRADQWRVVRFDHDMTIWPLRGSHVITPCLDCHTSQRWIGLSGECWDCHVRDAARAPAAIEAHSLGQSDCAGCHPSQLTWSL